MTNLLKTLIRATGFSKAQELDAWYTLYKALDILLAQLDADAGITATNFEALCFTAICNTTIVNSQGNSIGAALSTDLPNFRRVSPAGFSDLDRHLMMYNYTNMWETLCEKLDADGDVSDTNYEALCYTATFLHVVKDPKGVTDLGNGVVYYFKPGGPHDRKQLIEWLYNAIYSLELLATKLDSDGGVTDTDYEANSYTAYCTVRVENAAGSVIGN